MSDEQKKKRFFVAGDVVKHIKTGVIYDVESSNSYGDYVEIFYEPSDVECFHKQLGTYAYIPFYELEMVEPHGEHMGMYTPSKMAGRGDEDVMDESIVKEWLMDKRGYVNTDQPHKRLDHETQFGCVPVPIAKHKAPPPFIRADDNKWVFLNHPSIQRVVLHHLAGYWIIVFHNGNHEGLEPKFTRQVLDAFGLTEDIEPRIGNQEQWDKTYRRSI